MIDNNEFHYLFKSRQAFESKIMSGRPFMFKARWRLKGDILLIIPFCSFFININDMNLDSDPKHIRYDENKSTTSIQLRTMGEDMGLKVESSLPMFDIKQIS